MILQLYNWLKGKPLWVTHLLFLSLFALNTMLLLLIFGSDPHANDSSFGMSMQKQLIYGLILAPIIETLLLQALIIEICRKLIKSTPIILLISTIVFASTHLYSFYYFIAVLVPGLLLALLYFIEREKHGSWSAILKTSILHSLFNAFAITWNYLNSQGCAFTNFFG